MSVEANAAIAPFSTAAATGITTGILVIVLIRAMHIVTFTIIITAGPLRHLPQLRDRGDRVNERRPHAQRQRVDAKGQRLSGARLVRCIHQAA